MSREDSSTAPVPPGYHVETFDEAERAVLGRFFTELDGPVFAILDLIDGGTGWGLCPDGLNDCETSYFSGLELAALLTLALFVLLGLIAVCNKAIKYVQSRSAHNSRTAVTPR